MTNPNKIVKDAVVKRIAKEHGKRVGKDFLAMLEEFVQSKLQSAILQHNGGKKTLDSTIAGYIGIVRR